MRNVWGAKFGNLPRLFFVLCSSWGKSWKKSVSILAIGPNGCCSLFDLRRSVRPRKDLHWEHHDCLMLECDTMNRKHTVDDWRPPKGERGCAQTQSLSVQTLRLDGKNVGRVSDSLDSLHPPLIAQIIKKASLKKPTAKKSHFILQAHVTAVLCGTIFLPVKWWSLWAVLRKLSDATFYLICWNVASHVDEVHIFSQICGWGYAGLCWHYCFNNTG